GLLSDANALGDQVHYFIWPSIRLLRNALIETAKGTRTERAYQQVCRDQEIECNDAFQRGRKLEIQEARDDCERHHSTTLSSSNTRVKQYTNNNIASSSSASSTDKTNIRQNEA